ncbi:ATP-binding cassette domain-containing protein, partial [Blautia sp. HCP28S3_G10]
MSEIKVINLTFGYEGHYDNVFENVNFQIDTNWKLGFIGRNGRGKTTFLNLLLGKYHYTGIISSNVTFEYFPYHVKDMSQYTIDVMHEICPESEDWELLKEVSKLDVNAEVLYRPFETLSNGERTKVLLAALFTGSERFLLIDEPTN